MAALSKATKRILLLLSILMLAIGNIGSPLIVRLYFVKGGMKVWFSCFLQTCAFPILLIPLLASYFYRRKTYDRSNTKLIHMRIPTFLAAAAIGVTLGGVSYLSSFGAARIPVSTSTLILATQLAFTAVSAFFLVKQKFTYYSVNAIALLTVGAAVLALHANSDRPEGESKRQYIIGFIVMFASSAVSGLLYPVLELIYMNAKQGLTYSLVMEIQLVMNFAATIFALIGMIANNDFKAIPREAKAYELGEVKYYLVVVSNAIIGQLYTWGAVGVVFCSSALVNGVLISVLLPVSQVLAVIFFHDKFTAEKGISLALCLWGFVSYFYGDYKKSKKFHKKNNKSNQKQYELQIQESTTNTTKTAPPTPEMEP
ncbi:hypothetical protein M9H77_32141 [Catharanthus roseus]|uniref:Uncharacterized protein n=1 Tax=Catharanthus roseus TaxID=4058 RepID=A0ACC0A2F3_CATRO|nr:hypothetical protein M9H77_32141 [Catharanthus roseus]